MFFALVVTYSFIIGMHEAIKIVIATYIAIVAVQGIGNLVEQASGRSEPILSVLGMSVDISVLASVKLVLFVGAIIFLAIKGGFDVEYNKDTGGLTGTVLTGIFGFATAGLLLSTLLTFVADAPLLDSAMAQTESVAALAEQSNLMEIMILNQNIWFAAPAILLIAVGFIGSE